MSWLLYLIVRICRNTFTLPPPLRLKAFQEEVFIVFQLIAISNKDGPVSFQLIPSSESNTDRRLGSS